MITTGQVHIAGEVTTAGYVDIADDRPRDRPAASATTPRARASTAPPAASACPSARSRPDIAQGVDTAYEAAHRATRHGRGRRSIAARAPATRA